MQKFGKIQPHRTFLFPVCTITTVGLWKRSTPRISVKNLERIDAEEPKL